MEQRSQKKPPAPAHVHTTVVCLGPVLKMQPPRTVGNSCMRWLCTQTAHLPYNTGAMPDTHFLLWLSLVKAGNITRYPILFQPGHSYSTPIHSPSQILVCRLEAALKDGGFNVVAWHYAFVPLVNASPDAPGEKVCFLQVCTSQYQSVCAEVHSSTVPEDRTSCLLS